MRWGKLASIMMVSVASLMLVHGSNFRGLTSPKNIAVNATAKQLGVVRLMALSTNRTQAPDVLEITLGSGARFVGTPEIFTRGASQQLGAQLASASTLTISIPGGWGFIVPEPGNWVGIEIRNIVVDVDSSKLTDSESLTALLTVRNGQITIENPRLILGFITGKKLNRKYHVVASINQSFSVNYTAFSVANLSPSAGMSILNFLWYNEKGALIRASIDTKRLVAPNGVSRFFLSEVFQDSDGTPFRITAGRVEFDVSFVGPPGVGGDIDVLQTLGIGSDAFAFLRPTVVAVP